MQLYLTQTHVTKDTSNPFWARQWDKSAADASKTRTKFIETYEVKRKDVTTTAVEVGTRKEPLLELLNKISSVNDGAVEL